MSHPLDPRSPAVLDDLPGANEIRTGLADLKAGRHSIAACLARIARPRLARAGLIAPPATPADDHAELDLYHLLAPYGPNAHSRFNALIRQLVSFEHALDHQRRSLRHTPNNRTRTLPGDRADSR